MESYYLERHGSFALPVVIALNQNEVTLGHKETPELKNAPNVSESHAMFLRSCTGEWFIKDMSSMNGVFLNSVRIGSGLYAVKVGDIVGLGSKSGDSDRDYVFIMCNKCTLPLVSSSPGGCSKDHCAESGYLVKEASASNCAGNNVILASKLVDSKRNSLPVFHADVSDSIFGVQIKKEVVEKEPEESDKEKSENNHVNEIENHVLIKREKPETPCDNLCAGGLLNTAENVNNSAIHPLFVDSRNYGNKNALTDNIFGVQIRKEVVEKEPDKSDEQKLENSNVNKTVNHIFLTKEKPETPCFDLYDDPLLNTAESASNFAIHPLFVDRNYDDKNALMDDTLRKPSDSLIETLPPDVKNHKYKNISEVPNSSLRPSDSISTKTIAEGEKLCSHRSLQNKNYGMKQFPTVKDLKVVLKMYDNIVLETYIIQRRNTKNALDSSGSDVIIPPKQPGHRLRTDSSSSSDESEEPYAQSHEKFDHNGFSSSPESRAHNGKLCRVSNEHTETEKHEDDRRCNAENDSDSSGPDVVIPHKQPGHKLRIDSSSDETEEPYAQSREKFDHIGFSSSAGSRTHNGKLCRVSNQHTETEKHEEDHSHNVENNLDSSGADVIIPYKQHDHRLRINSSSSSSDESEKPHVTQSHEKFDYIGFSSSGKYRAHTGKPCKVSNEHSETEIHEDDHNAQLTPNDDLYDSDWSYYFTDSQDVYEHDVTDEDPFGSDIENFPENVPCSDSVLNSSALRTNVTNHHKHLDRKELPDLMWVHSAETKDGASKEELLDPSENIENIKFLNDTGNKQILPEKTFNGSKSEKTISKTERNDFLCPSARSGLSDKVERLDVPYSDHVGPQGEEKLQKPMSTNYKKPWLPGNHQKASYSKEEMGSSSKHVEFDIFPHTEHLENEKQHAENSCRSSFSVNNVPACLEEETGNSKKSSDAILNDLRRRQKEKTLTKTVLTEAMPMQYRSQRKRGREEWFRDQYDDDRPTIKIRWSPKNGR